MFYLFCIISLCTSLAGAVHVNDEAVDLLSCGNDAGAALSKPMCSRPKNDQVDGASDLPQSFVERGAAGSPPGGDSEDGAVGSGQRARVHPRPVALERDPRKVSNQMF